MAYNPKEPQVYIFFSVDLIGSTQKKQESQGGLCINSWVSNLVGFYSSFQERFEKSPIKLWKYNGDEILFYSRIKDWNEAFVLVKKFRDAIETNNTPSNKYPVKGTIWTAGFPIRNFILCKPMINNSQVDFIGPDIDLGFRIAAHANKDRIAVSPELALGLLDISSDSDELKWHYYGRRFLKGIVEDCGMPIVFLSSTKHSLSLQDKEENLLGQITKTTDLKEFLISFFKQSQRWRQRHFFEGCQAIEDDPEYGGPYKDACSAIDNIGLTETVEDSRMDANRENEIINGIDVLKTV